MGHTMVVLASSIEENEKKGFTTGYLSRSLAGFDADELRARL